MKYVNLEKFIKKYQNKIVDICLTVKDDGPHTLIAFNNGYGASIISNEYSYGGDRGLYEIALIKICNYAKPVGNNKWFEYELCDDRAHFTNGVVGYLTDERVCDILVDIVEKKKNLTIKNESEMTITFTKPEYLGQAIESFNKIINNCGYLTVKRIKEICDINDIKDTDSIYGWRSVDEFKIEHAKFCCGCWELELPEPIILIDDCIDIKGKIKGKPISKCIAASILEDFNFRGKNYDIKEDELAACLEDILKYILFQQKLEGKEVENK